MPISSILLSSAMGSGGGGQGQGIANMAGGLVGGITGLFQRKKAKRLLKEAGEQPLYQIPQEILRNQKTAELNAQQGMPSQQYNNAMKSIQQSQNAALAGATDRRSALMALPSIQRQANAAYGNLDAQSAQMQRQNQQTLYNVGNTTAQYRDKAYNTNELQPWQRKYNYAQSLLGAANQNIMSGIDKFIGGGGSLLAGGMGGGTGRKMKAGASGEPTYYGDYNANSDYSGFETGF